MSAEPPVLRRAIDAVDRGDADAFAACFTDDVVLEPLLGAVEGTYHGRDGARRWLRDREQAWLEIAADFGAFRPAGPPGTWIAAGSVNAHGRESGVQVEQAIVGVARLDGELVAWLGIFTTEEEALARASETA